MKKRSKSKDEGNLKAVLQKLRKEKLRKQRLKARHQKPNF